MRNIFVVLWVLGALITVCGILIFQSHASTRVGLWIFWAAGLVALVQVLLRIVRNRRRRDGAQSRP